MQFKLSKTLKLILVSLIFPGLIGINFTSVAADGAAVDCAVLAPGPNGSNNVLREQFRQRCQDCLTTLGVTSSPNDECRTRMTAAASCVSGISGINPTDAGSLSAAIQTQISTCYDAAENGYNFFANCSRAGRSDCVAKETDYRNCLASSTSATKVNDCYTTVGITITIETDCPTGSWRTSSACGGNCATKGVTDLFNSTYCDGRSRWLFEDAQRNRPDLTPDQVMTVCGIPAGGNSPTLTGSTCNAGCAAGQWSCTFNNRTNCANAETQAMFNSTWVDGQAQWKREAAQLLGDSSANGTGCGGSESTRISSNVPVVGCRQLVNEAMTRANLTNSTINDVAYGYCSTTCPPFMASVVDRNVRCNNLTLALLGCINGNTANIQSCTARVDLAANVYGTCERAQLAQCNLKQDAAINCIAQRMTAGESPLTANLNCFNTFVEDEVERPRGTCEANEVYCSECNICVDKNTTSCEIGCQSIQLQLNQFVDKVPALAQCIETIGEDLLAKCITGEGSASSSADDANCMRCLCTGSSWTGIGCINTTSTSGIVVSIMRIVLGVVGGIFLLLMISAGYLYNTQKSENIELAKKRITAMLAALIFITFSVLLLRVIGVNILDVTTLGVIG